MSNLYIIQQLYPGMIVRPKPSNNKPGDCGLPEYPEMASLFQLEEIFQLRTCEKNMGKNPFMRQSIYHYPYYFQDKDRQNYVICQEEKIRQKIKNQTNNSHIMIRRVQDFQSCEVLETWVVDPIDLSILVQCKGELSNNQKQKLKLSSHIQKPRSNHGDSLVFGRDLDMGKAIKFDPLGISRKHFLLKKKREVQDQFKCVKYVQSCLNRLPPCSPYKYLPNIVIKNILAYLKPLRSTIFQILDMRSTYGTYIYPRKYYELTERNKMKICLTKRKNPATVRVVKVFESFVNNLEQFLQHREKIDNFTYEQMGEELQFLQLPRNCQNYAETVLSLTAQIDQTLRTNNKLAISTLIIQVQLELQDPRFYILNSTKNNYTLGNGLYDILLINIHCPPNEQLLQISYQSKKWVAYPRLNSGCRKLEQMEYFPLQTQNFIGLGSSAFVILDIPEF